MNGLTAMWPQVWTATQQTIYMVAAASIVAVLLGLPLGVLLQVTDSDGLHPSPVLNKVLSLVVNIGRSIPFIILLVAVIPLTRLIVGTTIGSTAAIVPLALSAIPFYARLVETALREVLPGKVEAAVAMGADKPTIVRTVLVSESRPSLIAAATTTVVALIGYSAMAGVVGGGGLGDLAIRYGYQRFQSDVMLVTIVVLVVMVQAVQFLGDRLARSMAHR
ncbi:MAG: methionine ABC transporter permease [Candidatus Nanopelagicales bacterium]